MAGPSVTRPNILIVDDQRANLLALRGLLSDYDAEVFEAESGNEALALTLDHEFALALVDVNMPRMDGYEIVELLQGDPRTRTIPVIFLTAAYADEAHRLRGYQAGAVDYIEKPVEPLILHTKVRIFLDIYRHRRELQRATAALADQALRESELNLRVAMSVGQTVAFRLDRDFRCTWAHGGQVVSGLAPVVGLAPDALFEAGTAQRLTTIYRQVWTSARRERGDVAIRNRCAAEDQYFDLLVEPLINQSGAVEALACAAYDITARVRAQRAAERANDAKTRFLAAASHDLRQPVQALMLLLGLLRMRVAEPSAVQLIETMGTALDSTEGMLGKLMEFASLESGRVTVTRERFRLDEMVRRIAAEATPEAAAKGLALRVRIFACTTDSDPVLLERIVRNLVSNAIRYTDRGGVLLGLRRRRDKAVLAVYDTGIGIAASLQAIVFEEFRQLGNPERDRDKGVGLGLAIVARTVELLGHRLTLRSREGRGSAFAVEVPHLGHHQADDAVASAGPAAPRAAGRILLVEDDQLQAMGLSLTLQEAGFEVTTALDAPRALSLIGTAAPDLLLSDYRLPEGVTGVDLIRTLRRTLERPTPAIVITGDTQAAIAEEARREGCAIVHKPYSPKALIEIITQLLTASRPLEATEHERGPPLRSAPKSREAALR